MSAFLTTTAQVETELATARRELGMLRQGHSHLSGIPARHNEARIVEKEDAVATLVWHLDFLNANA